MLFNIQRLKNRLKPASPWNDSHSVLVADRLVNISAVFSADA